MFVLELENFNSPESVKKLIVDQLVTIVCGNVTEMGYFRGKKRIWIRNDEDMQEVQRLLHSKDSHNVTLWCTGSGSASKRSRTMIDLSWSGSDDESELAHAPKKKKRSRQEEKLERIDNMIDKLKAKQALVYNDIQYLKLLTLAGTAASVILLRDLSLNHKVEKVLILRSLPPHVRITLQKLC